MKLTTTINQLQGLTLELETREHHVFMDAKKEIGGKNRGATPKEYLLGAVSGCSAMDVISLLKKNQIHYDFFYVTAEAEQTNTGHPVVFESIELSYKLKSEKEINKETYIKAVELSMTKYCGVSAMLSKALPINYSIYLNDVQIASGQAKF